MAKEDYYRLLNVGRDANKDEIKKAYRKAAMACHPDRNPGDAEAERRFKDVSEAYEVLSNDQKRAAYDRFGHAAFEHPSDGGFGAGFGGGGFADIFEEMFGDFMGQARRGGRAGNRGSDLRYNLEISLEQAYAGAKITVNVPTHTPCEVCKGSGAAGGASPETCSTCRGAGRVRAQSGFFTVERTCPNCGGSGQTIRNPCKSCGGAGRVQRERSLQVTIPPGVEDGTRIRLAGEGEAGLRGGLPGDLYIFIALANHRLFKRDGADLYCRVPIPMTTAALGGSLEVPTISGAHSKITIPAGAQSGETVRLRGKGMSILRSSGHGDMYVELVVETPMHLTDQQKKLLQEFADTANDDEAKHSPESHGFFAKVKGIWDELTD